MKPKKEFDMNVAAEFFEEGYKTAIKTKANPDILSRLEAVEVNMNTLSENLYRDFLALNEDVDEKFDRMDSFLVDLDEKTEQINDRIARFLTKRAEAMSDVFRNISETRDEVRRLTQSMPKTSVIDSLKTAGMAITPEELNDDAEEWETQKEQDAKYLEHVADKIIPQKRFARKALQDIAKRLREEIG